MTRIQALHEPSPSRCGPPAHTVAPCEEPEHTRPLSMIVKRHKYTRAAPTHRHAPSTFPVTNTNVSVSLSEADFGHFAYAVDVAEPHSDLIDGRVVPSMRSGVPVNDLTVLAGAPAPMARRAPRH